MYKQFKSLMKDESGEFGIKQIAITVAIIVLIGAIVTLVRGYLPEWITDIWDMLVKMIDDLIN